jgi:hypothetical protein
MPDSRPYPSRATAEAAWWQAWRNRDFSWQGLARIPAGDGTLQDYWRAEAGRLVAEPGSDRLWTRFHCPFIFADGSPSPKAAWLAADWDDLRMSIRTRLARGAECAPSRLDGVVLDGLDEAEDDLPERDGYLWLVARQAFFRGDVELSRTGFEWLDVHGAWFGGSFRTDGAHIVNYNVYGSVQAQALPDRTTFSIPAVTVTMVGPGEKIGPSSKRTSWPAVISLLLAVIAIAVAIMALRP